MQFDMADRKLDGVRKKHEKLKLDGIRRDL